MTFFYNSKRCHQLTTINTIKLLMDSKVRANFWHMRERRKRSLLIEKRTPKVSKIVLMITSLRNHLCLIQIVKARRCGRVNCWVTKPIMTRIMNFWHPKRKEIMGIATLRVMLFIWPNHPKIKANTPNSKSWETGSVFRPENSRDSYMRKNGRHLRSTNIFRLCSSISHFWSLYFTNAIGGN